MHGIIALSRLYSCKNTKNNLYGTNQSRMTNTMKQRLNDKTAIEMETARCLKTDQKYSLPVV